MARRAGDGGNALLALVGREKGLARAAATADLRRLLVEHQGNLTRAAYDLGLPYGQALAPLVDTLGLRPLLDELIARHGAPGAVPLRRSQAAQMKNVRA